MEANRTKSSSIQEEKTTIDSPVLVEATTTVFRDVLRPYSLQCTQTLRRLNVADDTCKERTFERGFTRKEVVYRFLAGSEGRLAVIINRSLTLS